ncbi:MAG: hypothetical protein PVI44_05995 [Balneolaceae bacterium]|jgi:hypothetical protein
MKHTILLIAGIFFLVVSPAMAQTKSDSTENDPFKNDPFFSAPLNELLRRPSAHNDSLSQENRDVKKFVTELNDEGLDFRGVIEAGPYNSNPLYSAYPNLPMIHYNRVDALFLGLSKERMQWYHDDWLLGIPGIQPQGMIGYSTGQREWQYNIGLEKLLGRKNHVLIGAEYHNASTTNDDWRVGLNETTLTAFSGGYDYLDYYKQRGWGAYLLARSNRYFEGGIAFSDDRFSSLNRKTTWALFGSGGRFRMNPPVDTQNGIALETLNITSLTLSASFNPKRLVLSRNFTFSLTGIAEFADPGFGTASDFDYSKYTGELVSYINLEPGGVFKYRLRMSTITGEAPRFKQLYLGGIGTLRALPFKSMGAGNQMILSNAELQFGSPRFGSGSWIDFDDFYISLFLDSGWTDFDQDLTESSDPFSGLDRFKFSELKHNGGFGIGSSLIRCELAWDLNDTDRAPVFWIRFNPTF